MLRHCGDLLTVVKMRREKTPKSHSLSTYGEIGFLSLSWLLSHLDQILVLAVIGCRCPLYIVLCVMCVERVSVFSG